MAIYMLFENINAQSGLAAPFSNEWSKVDSLSWGVDRQIDESPMAGTQGTVLGVANLRRINISKAGDGASTDLFNKAVTGAVVGAVAISITDGTDNKTMRAFLLDRAYIVSAQLADGGGSDLREELQLWYSKIAMAILAPTGMRLFTWDTVQKTPWVAASPRFAVHNRWGIKVQLAAR